MGKVEVQCKFFSFVIAQCHLTSCRSDFRSMHAVRGPYPAAPSSPFLRLPTFFTRLGLNRSTHRHHGGLSLLSNILQHGSELHPCSAARVLQLRHRTLLRHQYRYMQFFNGPQVALQTALRD